MPHVIVKLWPGKSEQQKQRLADAIAKDVMRILHYGEESVSVAMEEVSPRDWAERYTSLTFRPRPISSTKSRVMASAISRLLRAEET